MANDLNDSLYKPYAGMMPKATVSPVTRAQQQSSAQNSWGQQWGWGASSLAPKLSALNPSGKTTLGWNQNYFAPPAAGGQSRPPSYSMDPALAALFAQRSKNRVATRDRNKRDVLMKSGLWQIAEKLFGGDTSWVQSVKNNPFSDMSNIANMYEGRLGKINVANEDLNQDNLFFSSHRTGAVLPQLSRDRQGEEYSVETAVRDAINSIEDSYMQSELQDKMEMRDAELAAAQYAAQNYAAPEVSDPWGGVSPAIRGILGLQSPTAPSAPSGGGAGGGAGGTPSWWGAPPISGLSVTENQYRGADGQYRPYRYNVSGLQRYGDGYRAPDGTLLDSKGRVVGQYSQGADWGR